MSKGLGNLKLRLVAAAIAVAATGAACGSGPSTFGDDAIGVRASTDVGVGRERLLLGVAALDGTRLGSPQDAVSFELSPVEDPGSVQLVPATFTWILEDVVGLYRAEADFDRAGPWQAIIVPEEGNPLEPVLFNVFAEPLAPALGAPAPVAPTPTLDDLPIAELTTDDQPDLRFYEMSLAEAIESRRPTVLVFSTPAYCQTSACGPLLDTVKGMAPDYPDVNFIHVEVFTGLAEPDFVPDAAHLAPAVTEEWYSLPSEPWVFVIDGSGLVAGRFEGVMDGSELAAVLGKISL
jgi:hypothetical protein